MGSFFAHLGEGFVESVACAAKCRHGAGSPVSQGLGVADPGQHNEYASNLSGSFSKFYRKCPRVVPDIYRAFLRVFIDFRNVIGDVPETSRNFSGLYLSRI